MTTSTLAKPIAAATAEPLAPYTMLDVGVPSTEIVKLPPVPITVTAATSFTEGPPSRRMAAVVLLMPRKAPMRPRSVNTPLLP